MVHLIAVPHMWMSKKEIPLELFTAYMEDTQPKVAETIFRIGRGVISINGLARAIIVLKEKGIVKLYEGEIRPEGN